MFPLGYQDIQMCLDYQDTYDFFVKRVKMYIITGDPKSLKIF